MSAAKATATVGPASSASASAPVLASDKQDVVFVAGASRGIGLGLVERFAEAGHWVVAGARNPDTATLLNALILKYPGAIRSVQLDVADEKSVNGVAARVAALKFGAGAGVTVQRLDVVINNAARAPALGARDNLDTGSADDYVQQYITNVVGPFLVSRALLPLLRRSAHPRLVNITSAAGSIADTNAFGLFPQFRGGFGGYRASKAALNALSATQSAEYNKAALVALAAAKEQGKEQGKAQAAKAEVEAVPPIVTVLAICPGPVDTDMAAESGFKGLIKQQTVLTSTTGIARVIAEAREHPNAQAVFVTIAGETGPNEAGKPVVAPAKPVPW